MSQKIFSSAYWSFLFVLMLSVLSFGFDKNYIIRISETEIVVDNNAKLMWQDSMDASNEKWRFNDAVAFCKNSRLGGYSDWRLPQITELKSIVDKTKKPTVIKEFKNTAFGDYWSNSYGGYRDFGPLIIDFEYGIEGSGLSTSMFYVRCTRNIR